MQDNIDLSSSIIVTFQKLVETDDRHETTDEVFIHAFLHFRLILTLFIIIQVIFQTKNFFSIIVSYELAGYSLLMYAAQKPTDYQSSHTSGKYYYKLMRERYNYYFN